MAVMFVCPKGDQSEDPDYCSVCGTRIEGAMGAASMDTSVERCPSCGIQRIPGARFCETCRYDFKAQAATGLVELSGALDAGITANTAPPTAAARYWEAIVSVDCSLDIEPDPQAPCPVDMQDRSFPLDLPENLVGRRSAARGIVPSIALNDPGVSHRHLMVYRNDDGSMLVSDVGSTNGTFLNGSTDRLEPGVKTPVADGDAIELGRWTRITFRSRS
jgi:hypothetical protein